MVSTRSKTMASVRTRDTNIELRVRKALFEKGYRYRIHVSKLPGSPDIVLSKYRAVVQVNGCFWHGHDCGKCSPTKKNTAFWHNKIIRNRERDACNQALLRYMGWKTLIVWQCALEGSYAPPFSEVVATIDNWIRFDDQDAEIGGRKIERFF